MNGTLWTAARGDAQSPMFENTYFMFFFRFQKSMTFYVF